MSRLTKQIAKVRGISSEDRTEILSRYKTYVDSGVDHDDAASLAIGDVLNDLLSVRGEIIKQVHDHGITPEIPDEDSAS